MIVTLVQPVAVKRDSLTSSVINNVTSIMPRADGTTVLFSQSGASITTPSHNIIGIVVEESDD